jgi:hypothetical protein
MYIIMVLRLVLAVAKVVIWEIGANEAKAQIPLQMEEKQVPAFIGLLVKLIFTITTVASK